MAKKSAPKRGSHDQKAPEDLNVDAGIPGGQLDNVPALPQESGLAPDPNRSGPRSAVPDSGDYDTDAYGTFRRPRYNYRVDTNYGSPPISRDTARLPNLPQDTLIGIHYTVNRILRDPSEARRYSLQMSRMMEHDLDVAEPLQKVVKLCKQMPMSVVPEDENDEEQSKAAKLLERLIAFPEPEEVWAYWTYNAMWSGIAAGLFDTDWVEIDGKEYVGIVGWNGVESDSVMFTAYGQPVLKVSSTFDPSKIPGCEVLLGPYSRVRTLSDHPSVLETDRWVSQVVRRQPALFEEPEEAARMWRGEGVRDICWWEWYTRNHVLLQFVKVMERFGIPVPVGKYPSGDKNARVEVENALMSYMQGSGALLIPVNPAAEEAARVGLEFLEPGRGASDSFKWYLEWSGDRLRALISGATLTSQTSNTGMNSGMAEVHENMLHLFIRDMATKNANTITNQIIPKLQRWNDIMPDKKFRASFKQPTDRERKEKLAGVQLAANLGLSHRIPTSELFDLIGIRLAEEGEETVQTKAEQMLLAGLSGEAPFGGANLAPGMPPGGRIGDQRKGHSGRPPKEGKAHQPGEGGIGAGIGGGPGGQQVDSLRLKLSETDQDLMKVV